MHLEEGDYGGVAGKRGQSRSVRGVGSAQVCGGPQGDELVPPSAVLQQGGHLSSSWRAGGGSGGTNLRVLCMLSPGERGHAGSRDSACKRNLQHRMVKPGLGREEEGQTKQKPSFGAKSYWSATESP